MKPEALSLRLVIPMQRRWASVAEHGCTSQELWQHYLACCEAEDEPEEVLAAAILIEPAGVAWNSTRHSESFFHIGFWLRAAADLLDGATDAGVWAWEESHLKMTRRGPLVILEEATHHPSMVLPPVCFELLGFARALALAAQPAVEILMGLPALAAQQFPEEWKRCQQDFVGVESDHQSEPTRQALREFRQQEAAIHAPVPFWKFLWGMWRGKTPVQPGLSRPNVRARDLDRQAWAAHHRQDLLEFLCSEDLGQLSEDCHRLCRMVG